MEKLRHNLKLFNYRPIVLVFLSIISGILATVFWDKFKFAVIITSVIVIGIIIFYSVLHKTYKYLIIVIVAFCLGCGVYSLFMHNSMHKSTDFTNKTMQGEVLEIGIDDSSITLLLTDVIVNEDNLEYNVEVYYNNIQQVGYVNIKVGDIVKFKVNKQYDVKYIQDSGIPNTYNLDNNLGTRVSTQEIEIVDSHLTVRNKILNKIKSSLHFGLNNENAEMIYSAMFGDKSNLNENLYNSYKISGLAHLLAVSGLHVGLIIGILYWILKKLKVKDFVRVIVLGVILLAYAYLCNFSYSVIRASVMAIVLLLATLFYSEYDLLNSICFAGCVITITQPISLFNVSFLLSFGCVFGICMLYPMFSSGIKKINFSNFITESMAISLATFISIAMVMTYCFGSLQPMSILSNLILVPIFGILFTICFVVAIISLILPYTCYLLMLINPVLSWFNWLVIYISSISAILPMVTANFLTVILWFGLLAFSSQFYIKSTISKWAICSILFAIVSMHIYIIQ